jgi:protease I
MARIAFLVGEEFEDEEVRVPKDRLRAAGHDVVMIGLQRGPVVGKRGKERVDIEATPQELRPEDFAALVIPGGHSPDHLRTDIHVVRFVREFGLLGRPLAAVCHGPSLLIEAELVDGARVTSWPSIHTDLVNAGAHWEDAAVVEDRNLITSRNPGDLGVFSDRILDRISQAARVPAPA